MKVLHLVSNHKLTGPVDPAIRLARALRDISLDSRIAVGRPGPGVGPIDHLVRERGLEPITAFRLPKHRRFLVNRSDARALREMLAADSPDVLHAHLDNAHGIAARARRLLLRDLTRRGQDSSAPPRPIIVRSIYDDEAPPRTLRYRRLLGKESDGIFVFGESVRRALVERFGLGDDRVVKIDGAVVTDRFHPRPPEEDLRGRFGLPRQAIVAGIVARIQRHRRFEVLFEAFRRVASEVPDLYLLVLGRGTHAREIAHEGVRQLGIQDRVRLPGYVGGDDYPAAIACFDFKIFLVPGSDGTCRAVREAMATGLPIIAARRGLLPEMVRDGVDGFVVDDEVGPLATAIRRLATDFSLRRRLGASALERARGEFSQIRQAERVRAAYEKWLQPQCGIRPQPRTATSPQTAETSRGKTPLMEEEQG